MMRKKVYQDPRANQIDAMLKKMLKDRNEAIAVAESGAE